MTESNESARFKQPSYNDKRNILNKAHLIEPIIRHRIQDSVFYKQYLFLTNESTILPVIIEKVKYASGTDSNNRPSPFICCLLRLLELAPQKEIVKIYLNQLGYNEFKYLTSLMLIYIRLVWSSEEVYSILDTYYSDFRKLRVQLKTPTFNEDGLSINYKISYIDEWVDDLLNKDRVIDIILPRLIARQVMVERGLIEDRQYNISDDEDTEDKNNEESDYKSDSD